MYITCCETITIMMEFGFFCNSHCILVCSIQCTQQSFGSLITDDSSMRMPQAVFFCPFM